MRQEDSGQVSDEGLMQQMLLESALSEMHRAGPADAPQGRDPENHLVLERLQCGHCPVWLGLLGSNVQHYSADLLSSSHFLMEDAVQLLGLGPHDAWTEPQEHLSKDEVLAAVDASFAARISQLFEAKWSFAGVTLRGSLAERLALTGGCFKVIAGGSNKTLKLRAARLTLAALLFRPQVVAQSPMLDEWKSLLLTAEWPAGSSGSQRQAEGLQTLWEVRPLVPPPPHQVEVLHDALDLSALVPTKAQPATWFPLVPKPPATPPPAIPSRPVTVTVRSFRRSQEEDDDKDQEDEDENESLLPWSPKSEKGKSGGKGKSGSKDEGKNENERLMLLVPKAGGKGKSGGKGKGKNENERLLPWKRPGCLRPAVEGPGPSKQQRKWR